MAAFLLRKNTSEGSTLFVGDTVLTQAAGSSVIAGVRTYSGAEGKPIAEKSAKTGTAGTTLTWVFSNLEGTVDVQTVANAAGTTTRTIRDPYGAPIGSSGVWASGTGYMNKPATASTGLTTVGARTYDPVLGKFLSVDPVIDTNLPQQNTGYTYSGNNPTTYMDPTGLRLDPGCGWGKSCTAKSAPPSQPSYYTSVVVQVLSDGTPVYQLRRNPNYKPRPITTSLWGPTTREQQQTSLSLADLARSLPKSTASTPKTLRPKWGPLVGLTPNYTMPSPVAGVGIGACALVCGSVDYSADGKFGWSVSVGPRLELTVTAAVSVQDPAPFYLIGGCSATAILGASAEIGVGVATEQNSPGGITLAGTSSAGVRYGGGGGCSVGIKGSFG